MTHQAARPHYRSTYNPNRYGTPKLKAKSEMTERGTIKWFDPHRGFGFITRPGQCDAFIHMSVVRQYRISPDQLQPATPVCFSTRPQEGKRPDVDAIGFPD